MEKDQIHTELVFNVKVGFASTRMNHGHKYDPLMFSAI
jgi:hypothetical protein